MGIDITPILLGGRKVTDASVTAEDLEHDIYRLDRHREMLVRCLLCKQHGYPLTPSNVLGNGPLTQDED